MAGNNSLDALFAAGMTREQFIAKYNELKETEENNENAPSIFKSDLTRSIGALYDTIDTNHDNNVDESELATLKGYDTTDGENTLSEADVAKLYDKTLKKLSAQQKTGTPEEMYNAAVNDGGAKPTVVGEQASGSYISNLTTQIDLINELINARQNQSNSKLMRYQAELDNLMINESNLSREEKNVYAKNAQDLNRKKAQVEEKLSELQKKQNEIKVALNELTFIQSRDGDNADKDAEKWQKKISDLQGECSQIQTAISKLNSDISNISRAQKAFVDKATGKRAEFAQEKTRIQNAITTEGNSCAQDIEQYKGQISTLDAARAYAVQQSAQTAVVGNYSDSDTEFFSGDAQDLKNIWHSSHPNLTDGFYNKVIEISKRIGCDANALMAVMNSESGISTTAQNPHGGATGLIQFMPQTAQALGTSTAALKQMSPEQQLVYVEKCLMMSKRVAGFKPDEKVSQGQLYALIFLPAYAKRDVLTTQGHKFYNANKGLDMDKDGQITIADLSARVEAKKPKSIRRR